ncbi:MAG: CDGSH iron-sulfur domain-containing protein [Candidatus Nanopelagicales bacterium]
MVERDDELPDLTGLTTVMECPGGPVLMRRDDGADPDGIFNGRPVVAICRCGKSKLFPLCDATHKFLQRRDRRE